MPIHTTFPMKPFLPIWRDNLEELWKNRASKATDGGEDLDGETGQTEEELN